MSDTVIHTITTVQRPSMWAVVFLNDDYTPMAFVEQVLIQVYHLTPDNAHQITLLIHQSGRAKVGSYTHDVACHKADHTLLIAAIAQHPLQVYPERI